MSNYVVLDTSNIVQNTIVWDGVAQLNLPNGWTTHLLPTPPPAYQPGDTYNPATDVVTPGAPSAETTTITNLNTIVANIAQGLAQLNTIINQANTFQAVAPYTTANLANLNDLLSKCQTMAAGIATIAQDLRYVARILGGQLNGTS